MKESRKRLLKMVYDHDQSFGGPLQLYADGSNSGFHPSVLRDDVLYLINSGYVEKATPALNSYCISITEKGEQFVENGFNPPYKTFQQTSFNFEGASIQNAVIGNNTTGNEFSVNYSNSISELQSIIQTKSVEDQQLLKELLTAIQSIKDSDESISRSRFAKFGNILKKYADLIAPVGTAIVNALLGQ